MRVRSNSPLFVLLVAFLLITACSSSTVVARDTRPAVTADESSADDDLDEADEAADPTDESRSAVDPEATSVPPREADEQSGFGLGGDDQIQGLIDDCQADSDPACDILFQLSEYESAEEAIALTCGGRSDAEVLFCTPDIQNDGEFLHFDIESAGLDDLVTACEDGDMTICDFLYFRSPVGSTFEQIGNTCGGRTSVALPDCRTFFAE